MKNTIQILILLIFLPFGGYLYAQPDIHKEVRVVKPYTPSLSDANKINLLPEFKDTTRIYHNFEYEISPKRFATNFRTKPIQPANMVGVPLKRLYKSQLQLGVDNYFSPYAELTINQLRDRKTALGLYAKHHSSLGKIKLENGEKVPANFSENLVNLYGRKIFSNSVAEAEIYGGYNTNLYYGYDPALDTILLKDDIKQKIINTGAKIRYYSAHPDSSHFNYNYGLEYGFLSDAYNTVENGFIGNASMAKFIGDWYTAVDLGLEIYNRNEEIDSTNNSIIRFNPSISKNTNEWKFLIGINNTIDSKNGSAPWYFYPNTKFEFNIVQNVLIPYLEVSGYREVNSYRRMLQENPFITPSTIVENADYGMIGSFGLKGRYSSKMAFDFRFRYTQAESMHFFTNTLKDTLMNTFDVEYDDGSIINLGGEISWIQSEKLEFLLRADYYKYDLDEQEFAWHMPDFKASLNASYNLRDKILIDGTFFLTGKRNVLNYPDRSLPAEILELKPYIDANLSAEYRYTSLLSFFVKVNNLTASKYQQWYQYPVQRFQCMAGFVYTL